MAKYSTRVNKIFRFMESLVVPSGKGQGKTLKLREFEKKFIADVYGKEDKGRRVVKRAILSMGRKNGKSLISAALALCHLVGPERCDNGEIYSAATERDQAAIIFKYAVQMALASPHVCDAVKIVESTKTMIGLDTMSVYRAVSAKAGSKYGFNPTVVIYDELAQAPNRELYDAFDTSMGAREEPLMIIISTQSNDPQHILSQLIDDALSNDDPSLVCHLYAVPETERDERSLSDEALWALANPALGDFRSLDEIRIAAERARRMPSFEPAFRNLYLNQRIDSKSPLISRAEWEKLKKNDSIREGERVYLGLDLSAKSDLTALVMLTDRDEPPDMVKAIFWKPQDTLQDHENRDHVPYTKWRAEGAIETTPGRAINYDWVAERIGSLAAKYDIAGIAFDRWRVDDLLASMQRIGVDGWIEGKDTPGDGIRLVPWGQGFKDMAPAIDILENAVLNSTFCHDGNPCLTWNFANAIAIADPAGNRKLDKSKTRFRIDGAIALVMAFGLKNRELKAEKPAVSAYNNLSIDEMKARLAL